MLTPNRLVQVLGENVSENVNLETYINNTPISAIINESDAEVLFAIRPVTITVQEALDLFSRNRKLQAIIITKTGINLEQPLGILTIANIIDLNKVVEDYDV